MMRTFSRWMPPPPTENAIGGFGRQVLILIVLACIASMALWVQARVVGLMLVAFYFWASWSSNSRDRKEAAMRPGEDIGTFARAFDRRRRDFDPWVIRAVWDALKPYRTFPGGAVPLRPSDPLDFIEPDDLDDGIVQEIAERTGRPLARLDENPLYGNINTVESLVEFFWRQPRTGEPSRQFTGVLWRARPTE